MMQRRFLKKDFKKIDLEKRKRKFIYFLLAFMFYVVFILIRLFYLQVHKNDVFSKMGEKNFTRTEVIPSRRGNVLDCNKNLLATNRPVFDLYWQGSGSFRLNNNHKELIKKISSIVGQKFLAHSVIRKIERAERFSRQLLIKKDISQEEISLISEQFSDSKNMSMIRRFERVYPYKFLASHILGYLRRAQDDGSLKGLYGLERKMQGELQGKKGYISHVTNATGKKIEQKEFKNAIDGNDIQLTLDLTLQSIAEMLFEPGQSGSFVIMDPDNGSIKAMLSYPNFDPNLFLGPISQEVWSSKFCEDSPLLNRAIHSTYPPASIFKLITFVAGLEEGVISRETEFDCKGHTLFCGRKYNCHRRWGHGLLSAKKALGMSCNVPCYEIAQKITIDQLAEYAMRFGLGQRTGFLFEDKSGLVPTSYWKQAYRGERWWKGETLSVSIGQSFLLATPLQIARMVASVCSGYLVKPRILVKEDVEKYPLYISRNTVDFLREVMREVVLRGTGRCLKKFSDFSVWAKTGTAQTISLKKQKLSSKYELEHAWFASFFSYKEEKPLTMVVLVENAGSSRFALKIAEKFFKIYKEVLKT